ncbi:MAG: hypothetical protein ACOYU7_05275 [Bacillota bacterium]
MEGFRRIVARYLGEGKRLQQNLKLIALAVIGLSLVLVKIPGASAPTGAVVVNQDKDAKTQSSPQISKTQSEEEQLEARLEAMLSQISGAGEVKVSVKLDGSSTSHFAVNASVDKRVTEETDKNGGHRTTTENNESNQLVVVQAAAGAQDPVVERELAPRVVGVLVVAEGARNPKTKSELFEATVTALGVEPHKIMILPKKF